MADLGYDDPKANVLTFVCHSDDNGQSWKRTESLEDKSGIGFPNECQVAEAANGDIVMISRNQGGEGDSTTDVVSPATGSAVSQ